MSGCVQTVFVGGARDNMLGLRPRIGCLPHAVRDIYSVAGT